MVEQNIELLYIIFITIILLSFIYILYGDCNLEETQIIGLITIVFIMYFYNKKERKAGRRFVDYKEHISELKLPIRLRQLCLNYHDRVRKAVDRIFKGSNIGSRLRKDIDDIIYNCKLKEISGVNTCENIHDKIQTLILKTSMDVSDQERILGVNDRALSSCLDMVSKIKTNPYGSLPQRRSSDRADPRLLYTSK